MALQKQLVPIPLTAGVSQRSDDLIGTSPGQLDNGTFIDKTTFRVRNGMIPRLSGVTAYGSGAGPSGACRRVTTRGDQLLMEHDNGAHVPDIANAKWQQITSQLNRGVAEARGIFHGEQHVMEMDIAGDATTQVVAFITSFGSQNASEASTLWIATYQNGQQRQLLSLVGNPFVTQVRNMWSPRVVKTGSNFFVYWAENKDYSFYPTNQTTIYSVQIPTSALGGKPGTGWSFPNVVAGNCMFHDGTDFAFDVCVNPHADGSVTDAIFLAYVNDGGGVQQLVALRLSTVDGFSTVHAANTGPLSFAWNSLRVTSQDLVASGRSGYIVLGTNHLGSGLVPYVADLDAGGAFTVNAGSSLQATQHVGRLGVCYIAGNSNGPIVCWETDGVDNTTTGKSTEQTKFQNLVFSAFSGTYGVVSPKVLLGLGIGSDPFLIGSVVYLPGIFYSETQSHYTLAALATETAGTLGVPANDVAARLDMNGTFMFNAAYTAGSDTIVTRFRATTNMPHTIVTATGALFLAWRGNGSRLLARSVDITPLGLDLITFDTTAQVNSVELGPVAVLAGAYPHLFDGQTLTELGFDTYPEYFTYGVSNAGSLADGTYGVCMMYEWYDAQGELHRSAIGTIQNVVVSGQGGFGSIALSCPTLRQTLKTGVGIVVYCTQANGTVFYRTLHQTTSWFPDTDVQDYVPNDPTTTKVNTIIRDVTGLVGSEIAYTTGGVLPNLAYPACKNVSTHQNRVVFSGTLDKTSIGYTHEKNPDDGLFPGFHPTLNLAVDPLRGRVSGVLSVDDKLVIAQESAIGCIFGRGPNTIGLDNQFSDYNSVLVGYGHSWASSSALLRDPAGFWFLDQRGLRHFNRGLQLDMEQIEDRQVPLGSSIDSFLGTSVDAGDGGLSANYPLVGAVYDPVKKLALWALSSSSAFVVFDYENSQFSTFSTLTTNVPAWPVMSSGIVHFGCRTSTTNKLFYMPDTAQHDDDGAAPQDITLTYATPWLKLAGVQGFQRATRMLMLLTSSYAANVNVNIHEDHDYVIVGDPRFWLSASINYTANAQVPFQVQHQMIRQKGESVRFLIAVTGTASFPGTPGTIRLSELALEVGVKRGTFKLPATNRF